MKALISRHVSRLFTSRALRDLRRRRNRRPGPPVADYFHQADDPYSHLVVQVLPALAERYGLTLRTWLAPPPDDAAAPERERLRAYGLRDAARLALRFGLEFPGNTVLPGPERTAAAAGAIAAAADPDDFLRRALEAGRALWAGEQAAPGVDPAAALAAGQAERARLGHYLGGMLAFEGEWYWGVDRINHLEERLAGLGFDRRPGEPPLAPYQSVDLSPATGNGTAVVDFWFSFRSPYSWIVFPRVVELTRALGAELRLRYILPMVMRGLPVPRIKSRYIMLDTKREAERAGIDFGCCVDPVGIGTERAIAVLHKAVGLGLGEAFAEAGLKAAFAQGIDLADEASFMKVARSAGIDDALVREAWADDSWRITAEANRKALLDAGLWGAPTYRVNGGPAWWGQDRLWTLEEDIRAARAAG